MKIDFKKDVLIPTTIGLTLITPASKILDSKEITKPLNAEATVIDRKRNSTEQEELAEGINYSTDFDQGNQAAISATGPTASTLGINVKEDLSVKDHVNLIKQ